MNAPDHLDIMIIPAGMHSDERGIRALACYISIHKYLLERLFIPL
jgi:hypothetical protein